MKSACSWVAGLVRWAKFNVVGAIGVLLQLALIVLFTRVLRFPYLVATFIAVEVTVLHNFAWHERYTWRDRGALPGEQASRVSRLIRFNTGNGLVSIIGNLALMKALVGALHVPVLASSIIAITICSLVNFSIADRWVFVLRDDGSQQQVPHSSQENA